VFVIGQVFRLKVADVLYQGCDCGTVLRWEWGNSGCGRFVMRPINSTRTHNSAVNSSAAELGSTGKFRGPHVDPDDGADAVRACGVLLARRDDEAGRFEQERKRGHSHGQVVAVRRGLRPSLRGALVLVATVATTTMAMMAMEIKAAAAAATREVALPRQGNAMAMCDGNGTRAYAADNVGVGATAELTRGANESASLPWL